MSGVLGALKGIYCPPRLKLLGGGGGGAGPPSSYAYVKYLLNIGSCGAKYIIISFDFSLSLNLQ